MDSEAARKYWLSMTHGEKLSFVTKNGNAASFAYSRLFLHRAAARVQMARIGQAIAASRSTVPEPGVGATQEQLRAYVREGTRRMQPVFAEVHFYFVCWAGCRNMLQILVGQPEFLEAKKIFDGYRKEFEHYVAGRNSFEHFHERLPGQSEEHRVKEVRADAHDSPHRIYAGFSAGKYVHSNLEWDISPNGLARLEQSIDEVLQTLHEKVDEQFNRKFVPA
jgi:hypothetical protein